MTGPESDAAASSLTSNVLYREVKVRLDRMSALELTRLLDEGTPLASLCGYYEVLYEEGRLGEESTVMCLFFPGDQEDGEIRVLLLLEAKGIVYESIRTEILNRDEYLNAYKQHYTPLRPGTKVVIVPSWHRGSPEEEELLVDDCIAVYLDPGLAFGTGRHPTTTMCIRRLEQVHVSGLRVCDAGCGSGILSLAALALGAVSALAFDIDGNAIRATEQNGALNEARGTLTLVQGGFDLPDFLATASDLLLANLAANILVNAAGRIDSGPHPRMLLSGILSEQADQTLAAFPGWRELFRDDVEGWALLDLVRR